MPSPGSHRPSPPRPPPSCLSLLWPPLCSPCCCRPCRPPPCSSCCSRCPRYRYARRKAVAGLADMLADGRPRR
ncbi:hypothetical protein PF008_g33076 [Phytophthora fragariae]|uniref:Uncharacterized protein n=1 Tax=Phytophthora fragariae TaxID=53985 RepID=A0A6G0PY14_9STRA|nr:hypothetical protein PF008_g33076 [Phytophthora fragariae]